VSKSLFVLIAALMMAGCVSVATPTAGSPTSSPTLGITTMAPETAAPTASAAATPTQAATLPPTEVPTEAPSPTAVATESAGPTTPQPSGGFDFDPRDLLQHETFSDPASGWGVGEVTGSDGGRIGEISYTDDALQFDVDGDSGWMWTRRATGATNGTMRLAGQFVASTEGAFGLLCASGTDFLVGGIVTTDGGWSLINIGAEGVEELAGEADAGLDVPVGESQLLAIECAGTATGSMRMQLWLEGTGPVGIYESDEGPANFDRAAVYAEAAADGFSARVEEMLVFGVADAEGEMNLGGFELLSHVPADWRSDCYQSPVPPIYGGMATVNLACFIGEPGADGADVVEYARYPDKESMDAAYQDRIDQFGTGDGVPSCRDGSGERAYSIGDVETGRLACVSQFRGIRFDWTDDRLNILSSLVDFEGSFGATYTDWQEGGPNL